MTVSQTTHRPQNIQKKYAAKKNQQKIQFKAICSQRVFQIGLLQHLPGPFEKWTFINVLFYRAMPFLFWTFL